MERKFWYRTLLLLTVPLISLTGLWQLPVFFGQVQPHECTENGSFILKVNDTSCAMENTYLTEFGLYCDKKSIGPWLQSAANLGMGPNYKINWFLFDHQSDRFVPSFHIWTHSVGGMVGHLLWGLCQDNFGRRKTYIITGLLTFVCAVAICMSQSYTFFIVFRVLFGMCANGMGSYTLPLELGECLTYTAMPLIWSTPYLNKMSVILSRFSKILLR